MKQRNYWFIFSVCLIVFEGCDSIKHTSAKKNIKTQIAEYSNDELKYKVFLMPQESVTLKSKEKTKSIKFSIMIINMKNNFSPLRRLCSDINDYNIYNEYLLNGAKNEIYLLTNSGINYPTYYLFENNYSAFPFETINVGYSVPSPVKKGTQFTLVYVDRVFSKDTISFNLNSTLK